MNVAVIQLNQKEANMGSSPLLRFVIGGFAAGIVMGLVGNGFTNIVSTLAFGIWVSILFAGVHSMLMMSHWNEQAKRKRPSRLLKNRSRKETIGTFTERLQSYKTTVGKDDTGTDDFRSKMPFWSAVDLNECQRTQPKSIYFIRMILDRIRRSLSNTRR